MKLNSNKLYFNLGLGGFNVESCQIFEDAQTVKKIKGGGMA